MWTEILLLAVGALQLCGADGDHQWSYHDQEAWEGLCASGRKQSPINIVTSQAIVVPGSPLQLDGYSAIRMQATNNGHTVKLAVEDGDRSSLSGGPLSSEYILEQLHFHWIGEHAIDNVKYPLEMHLVHRRADVPTLREARHVDSGVAVIAVMFELTTDPGRGRPLHEIMRHMPHLINSTDDTRPTGPVDIRAILGDNVGSYYTYGGSLTTPDCFESVIWIILDTPLTVTDHQYRYLSAVQVGGIANFRHLQPLNGRPVFKAVTSSGKPLLASAAALLSSVFLTLKDKSDNVVSAVTKAAAAIGSNLMSSTED